MAPAVSQRQTLLPSLWAKLRRLSAREALCDNLLASGAAAYVRAAVQFEQDAMKQLCWQLLDGRLQT